MGYHVKTLKYLLKYADDFHVTRKYSGGYLVTTSSRDRLSAVFLGK